MTAKSGATSKSGVHSFNIPEDKSMNVIHSIPVFDEDADEKENYKTLNSTRRLMPSKRTTQRNSFVTRPSV